MSVTAEDLSAFVQNFPDTLPLSTDESERMVRIFNHLRAEDVSRLRPSSTVDEQLRRRRHRLH